MSDTQKPVEETTAPAAAEAAAPAEPAAVSEPAAASDEITSTETPAPAKEDSKAEEKKDAANTTEPPKPISGGHLGYKGPGLVKGLRFSKRYIWFGDEAVEAKDLNNYLRGEKPDVAHPIVAWSTQTGKGLLYFTKTVDQKAQPIHVINLADISDVCTDGLYEFYFKVHGHKHSFQAQVDNERDAWVETLRARLEEAKGMVESITKSDGYAENLEKLGKPAAGLKTDSTPKKSTDKAPEGVKRSDASGSDGETGERKPSRSVSRKRGSLFGFMSKKEESEQKKDKEEDKKEDKKEEDKTEEPAAAAEPAAESAKTEEPAPAAAPAEEAAEQAAEPKDTPKPSKRISIFGSIMRKDKKDTASPVEEKKEAAPATPAKDTDAAPASEPVDVPSKPAEPAEETAAAPTSTSASSKKGGVLSFFKKEYRHAEKKEEAEAAPKADEPAAPATETETPAPTETATETTEPAATAEQPKTRRRSSFFTDLVGKVAKKPGEVSDSETEHKTSPSSPLPKLQGLFRGKSHREPKKEDTKKEATPPPTVEETAEPATESKDAAPAPAAEPKSEETPAAAAATTAEPSQTNVVNGTIGDVVGDAITVGQTPQQVQAAA